MDQSLYKGFEGQDEGRQARDREIAFSILRKNLDVSLISSRLPEEEISKLKREMKKPL